MDYSNIRECCVYTITNKINGKMYVGQTVNYSNRRREHFCRKETCPALYNAFRKYGKENFEMKPLVTFTAINDFVAKKVLNWLESYYIDFFNTYKHGYNLTKGGDGVLGFKMSKDTREKLSKANSGKIVSTETREKHRAAAYKTKNHIHHQRKILQYSLEGEFIKEWNSIAEATENFIRSRKINTALIKCLRGERKKAYGYIWRYKTTEKYPLHIDSYVHPKSRIVYHYSKNNTLLGVYNSPKDASIHSGTSYKAVLASCAKKRKFALTDWFSYKLVS